MRDGPRSRRRADHMSTTITTAPVWTRGAGARILLGWAAVTAMFLAGPDPGDRVAAPILALLLGGLVAVIVLCAFGVVEQAEQLARRLGEPYGTLVLTLSIVLIEVALISAVMLGPGAHAAIARDSVMAVSMIIMNLAVGLALVVAARRHRGLRPNPVGASIYLALLIVLLGATFALPAAIGDGGALRPWQAAATATGMSALYAFFLYRQVGVDKADFQEITEPADPVAAEPAAAPAVPAASADRRGLWLRAALLLVTVIPIVLLSHELAPLLDDAVDRVGAPTALPGVLIAVIVFLPETLTTVHAAAAGQIQRVSNLCHGALVSTVGVTVPVVLIIGLGTGQTVLLAESPANLALLIMTIVLTVVTFGKNRVTVMHGVAHLALFGLYALAVFS